MGGGRRKQQQEDVRKTVYDWAKLYNEANTPAEKKLALDYGRSFVGSLPPELQEAMKPTIEAGPFGAENMKREQFEKMYGQMPQITADPKNDPYMYATQAFHQHEWKSKREEVSTDKKGYVPRMIGVGDGNYAIRNENGVVSILDSEDLVKMGEATKLGLPAHAFLPDGRAKIKDEKRTFTNPWGASQTEQAYIDIEKGKVWEVENINLQTKETSEDKALRGLSVNLLNENEEDPVVAALKTVKDNPEEAMNVLETAFPNYHFIESKSQKYAKDRFGSIKVGDKDYLFFKGTPTKVNYSGGYAWEKVYTFWWAFTPKGEVVLYNGEEDGFTRTNEDIRKTVEKYNIPVPDPFKGKF